MKIGDEGCCDEGCDEGDHEGGDEGGDEGGNQVVMRVLTGLSGLTVIRVVMRSLG